MASRVACATAATLPDEIRTRRCLLTISITAGLSEVGFPGSPGGELKQPVFNHRFCRPWNLGKHASRSGLAEVKARVRDSVMMDAHENSYKAVGYNSQFAQRNVAL